MFYNTLMELTQDDEQNGLLSNDWEGNFKSDYEFQKTEEIMTFTFRNIEVGSFNF